jgi:phytoene dehydrogenase-like protein
MPTNSYDAIVIGDDLATATTAALCARRGLRTLWLTQDDRPGRYQVGPYKLPLEPMVWPTLPGSAAERIVRELAIDHALRRRYRDHRVVAQLAGPDLRIDLTADGPLWARELEREFGATAAAVDELWRRAAAAEPALLPLTTTEHAFPALGFWERRDVRRNVEAAAASADQISEALGRIPEDLRAVVMALAALGLRTGEARPLSLARALSAWRGGVVPLRGDADAVRDLVAEKFALAGGERRAAVAAEIIQGWNKVSGVRLANGEELGAGQVIAALSPTALAGLLGKKPPKELIELATRTDLIGYRYTLNLVVDQAGVPEGMAPVVHALMDPSKPPLGANAFSVYLSEPDDTGRVVVTAATILPAGAPLDEDTLRRECAALRRALLARLDLVMPFYGRHAMLLHSPHQDDAPEVPGGAQGYEGPRGKLAYPMREVWRATLDDGLGLAAMPYTTGIKNLSLTGHQIVPGLGVEGELVAGWSAGKLACAIAGKKKDYLRDETVGAAG